MTKFLNNRKYRVILNDQNSPWKKLKLEFLLVLFQSVTLLIYINNMLDSLTPNPKLLPDDKSFFVVQNINSSANSATNNLFSD